MKVEKQGFALAAMLFALVIGIHVSQVRLLDHAKTERVPIRESRYLPHGDFLRVAAIGYRHVVADLLWLRAIQVMGERKLSNEAGQWLYHLLDVVTTLDPNFVRAYEAGSHALCILVVMPELSNRLLEKGMRHNPQEWVLPFLSGINYFFEMKDDEKAAEAMARAARLPGSPERLMSLAARLFVSAKSPQQAVELLAKAYEETSDENVRKMLEVRLKESIVERDLQVLEETMRRYQSYHGQRPARLEDLVQPGLLRELPREPFGGHYLYEPETGMFRSSEVKERMRITSRRRAQ